MTRNYDYIFKCFRWLINQFAIYYATNHLPHELEPRWDMFYKRISDSVDWYNLTLEDVTTLGFLNWDEDVTDAYEGVWFIPQWILPALPEGLPVYTKDSEQLILNKETMSKEVMFGYLTFGVKLTKEED